MTRTAALNLLGVIHRCAIAWTAVAVGFIVVSFALMPLGVPFNPVRSASWLAYGVAITLACWLARPLIRRMRFIPELAD